MRQHGERTPVSRLTFLEIVIVDPGKRISLHLPGIAKKQVSRAVDTALLDSCDRHRNEVERGASGGDS